MASFQYFSSNSNNNYNTSYQQNIIPQDLIIPTRTALVEPNIIDFASKNIMGKGRSGRRLLGPNLDYEDDDNSNKKKMMHREIEKQRRKEMAALHALLRSLIPLEFIKVN